MKPPLFALLALLALAIAQPVTAQQFESAQVIPPPPASGDQYHNIFFGSTVDASGNWLAVADYAAQTAGEVYLYRFDGAEWKYRQTVTETDGWVFGWGMALDDNTLVVGDVFWGAPRMPPKLRVRSTCIGSMERSGSIARPSRRPTVGCSAGAWRLTTTLLL